MVTRSLAAIRHYLLRSSSGTATDIGADIRDEIEFHLAERIDELTTTGMPEDLARKVALERFGNPEQVAVECYAAGHMGRDLWRRLHVAFTAALLATVAVLSWQSMNGQAATVTSLPPPLASMLDNDWAGDVKGRVLDEQGRPIAGADVLVVVKTWPDKPYFQRAYHVRTSADGAFHVEDVYPLNDEYEVKLAAVADYRLLTSTYYSHALGELEPVVFELPASGYLAVQVRSESGSLLPDVEMFPVQRTTREGREHSVYFDSAASIIRRTNTEGIVELPYFAPGETAELALRAPNGDWQIRQVTVSALGEVVTISLNVHTDTEET